MTFRPPSAASSAGAHSPEEPFRVVKRRNRVPLSCLPCRTRKLKCDRSLPCANCVKRDGLNTSSCSYATPTRKKGPQPAQAAATPNDMQNRIERLESLVLSLVHRGATVKQDAASGSTSASGSASAGAPNTVSVASILERSQQAGSTPEDCSDTDDGLATSLGVLKVDNDHGKFLYVDQQHWHTILSGITEVKTYFASHKKDLEQSYEKFLSSKPKTARHGPTLLLGAAPSSEVELRAELPPKSSVLTLCGRYFNSMDSAVNIIHSPTFHKQLQEHWEKPSETPITWLGLLYAVLCLAMVSYKSIGDEPSEWKGRTEELAAEYSLRTVQCLATADFTKPADYTVETMILYVLAEQSWRWEAEFGLWLITSLITRIAFRMGYHRDAKWFPSLTPFQAEMRRRTWALVRMFDVFYSHTVSLPSMISDRDCDAQLPRNLFDEEFGPETKILPPSRPVSEATPVSYMIAKAKLCLALEKTLKATGKVGKPVPYDEILALDGELQDLNNEIPQHLRMQDLDGNRDPVTLIIARYNLATLHQKIICLLHRKYLHRAHFNPRYAHSRKRAIEAALETLRYLSVIHEESQPNGRLRSLRLHVNATASKFLLLPAMLVALDLHHQCQARRCPGPPPPDMNSSWSDSEIDDMTRRLQRTRDIWRGLAGESVEAEKAFIVLNIILEKIKEPAAQSCSNPNITVTRMSEYGSDQVQPEQSAATTLGAPSIGPAPGSDSAVRAFSSGSAGDATTAAFPGVDQGPASTASGSGFWAGRATDNSFMDEFDGGFGLDGGMLPNSIFNSLTYSMDLNTNLDWDMVSSYAQTANWGSNDNFQFFAGPGEQQEQGTPQGYQ